MKITLDTRFNGSLGPITLREAVQQLRERDLACTVPADAVEQKVSVFSDCVERGFTPLRSEIMAAYYMAERDATTEAFDRGLITRAELETKQAALARQFLT
ncbi:unnamed protein product [[Actinomadura] parvosata subsp. kistnae]|uniref:Uncharacterized protein n=1 Tax=[Actinomadura] parvosata subsp. kistnae TaxID=1909395 RepID=A0A1V0A7W2_9ACTN|nr:hypothetical protein [Nonomuraea sp. ATCC 55076]AQZ66273.1 hypothetical protein BKM31_36755 [Nonomuraea sp. ATCC 55076]SPL95720.1 unnamed protein product [Actinomadura parvosata subsp. kistnae]